MASEPAPYVTPAATDAAPAPPPALAYTDVTAESGIAFVHETGAYGQKLLPETVGSGVLILD